MSDKDIENTTPDSERVEVMGQEEESFASMLDKSTMGKRLHPGQRVKAKVVSISGDLVFIDLGVKSEGVVDLGEFIDKEGIARVREGDEIEAFFVSVQDGLMKLTTLVGGYSALTLNSIRDAYEAGVPVNGEVKREIKGGFDISVGGVRCFCPFSQIDLRGGREDGGYVGKTLPFKILEYEDGGKRIVLSRRVLLEQEKLEKIEKLKQTLATGMQVTAEVKSIRNFGAFVDLGGIDGLIPASELSWDRSTPASDLLSIGQKVTAKIISLDWDNSRLTLSLKSMEPDPWSTAAEKYPVDSKVSGTIVRLVQFGAFVRLEPGIEGLIHISNLGAGRKINHPKEVVETGQTVEVYVLSVDQQNRKISLSMNQKIEPVRVVLPAVGDILEGTVEKIMPYGIFLKTDSGITGLVPTAEIGRSPDTDQKRMFPVGSRMQAVVINVDPADNKIRLSHKAISEKAADDEFKEYKESMKNSAGPSGSLSSLGDILKAKLAEKESESGAAQ
jgi:small subunit ribosomal protein S1